MFNFLETKDLIELLDFHTHTKKAQKLVILKMQIKQAYFFKYFKNIFLNLTNY